MQETIYTVQLTLRIDWSELDYFGHVNNVSFFKYVQAARVHFWEQIGLTKFHQETNKGPMLASCKCDFKKPLFYPGQVHIHSGIASMGNTSFRMHHRLLDEAGALVAIAEDVLVMYDFNENEKVDFPQEFRSRITALEQAAR